jgi:hypothetical protein
LSLLASGGCLALTRVPAAEEAAVAAPAEKEVPAAPAPAPTKTTMPNGWRQRLTPAAVRCSLAAAQASPAASVILAQFMNGAPNAMDGPRPPLP